MTRIIGALMMVACMCYGHSGIAEEASCSDDELLREKIVGSWAHPGSPYGVSTFYKGGKFERVVYDSEEQREILVVAEGLWWIEDGRLFNKAEDIQPPVLPLDRVYIDLIVDITDDEMTVINEDGKQSVKIRLH